MGSDLFFRLRAIFRRSQVERELEDEVRFHLERQMEMHIAAGIDRTEAEQRARREFGAIPLAKEDAREARGTAAIDTVMRDLRYGFRVLAKSPAFTLVAVLTLALGIGANTAIFTLLDAIRLRSLPLKGPEQLAHLRIADMSGARGSVNRADSVTWRIWEQIRQRQEGFSGTFAWSSDALNLAPHGEVRMENALWVSGDFFPVLGIEPVAGRLFGPADDHRGCGTPGAVVSYAFWKSEFGGEASAIGRRLNLNGRPVEVIGVTPPGFFGLDVGRTFSVAVPVCSQPSLRGFNALDAGTFWWLTVMGRVKPGWTLERARMQLGGVSAGVFEASLPSNYPRASVTNYLGMKLTADAAGSGISGVRADYSESLHILLAIAGFVLLIACANLANLMLARASVRAKEIAVRLAIGASRKRLVAQLMVENLLIAGAGAGLGLAIASGLSRILVTRLSNDPKDIYLDLRLDWRVLAFTAGLGIVTCLLFGLAPALRATGSGPGAVLKQSGRGMAGSQERFAMRRMLAAAQVALSLVLLVGALLFTGSLRNLLQVETGFRTDHILIADLGYARSSPLKMPVTELPAYQRALLERVAAVPGVASVADTLLLPLSGASWGNRVWPDGAAPDHAIDAPWTRVSSGYFRTLGVRLVAGRDFDARDTDQSPKVAIVSMEFARRVMNAMPLGQRFRMEATPTAPETVYEIVGAAANTKYLNLRENSRPVFYLPLSQDPAPRLGDQLLIHSALPAATLIPGVSAAIAEADPGARFAFGQMQELVDGSVLRERLMAMLSTAFGVLAGVLAAIGLYGVIAYSVTRRTNEIGIRMALGASPREIARMVLGESGRVVAIGVVAGSALSLWVARFAQKMLYGVEPGDAWTLAMAAAVLGAVALTAAWMPARRAARLDPTVALREE